MVLCDLISDRDIERIYKQRRKGPQNMDRSFRCKDTINKEKPKNKTKITISYCISYSLPIRFPPNHFNKNEIYQQ